MESAFLREAHGRLVVYEVAYDKHVLMIALKRGFTYPLTLMSILGHDWSVYIS